MAKVETTAKSVRSAYGALIQVGYCRLQTLLACENPSAYTHGVYGWNADVYDMGIIGLSGIAIVTGYRPYGNFSPSYELTQKYEKLAAKVDGEWSAKRAARRELLKQFVKEVIGDAA